RSLRSMVSLNPTLRVAAIAGILAASGILAACSDRDDAQADASKAPPGVPAPVAQALAKRIPKRPHASSSVETVATVAVKARVDGQILEVHVRDGQDVAAGDLLFRIDPKPYQAQLDQALANLASDQAQLEYLRGQEQRYQDLLRQNFVSREGYA